LSKTERRFVLEALSRRSRVRALSLVCLGVSLSGCFDGRLDSFELAVQTGVGGQAGSGLAAGTGGTPVTQAGAGGTGGTGDAAGTGGTGGTGGTDDPGGTGGTDDPGGAGGTDNPAGTGGMGGTGGQAVSTLLVDDFEDQNHKVEPDGWWYAADDSTGPPALMTIDAITDREPSLFAVHVVAGPTTSFGSFLGLDLPGGLFDATAYSTLSFWARMEPPGEISVRFQDPPGTKYEQLCELDASWREFELPLSGFVSVDDGTALDPSKLTHLYWWNFGTRPAYHLYVDDVRLLVDP
jgi:hypothetical protein